MTYLKRYVMLFTKQTVIGLSNEVLCNLIAQGTVKVVGPKNDEKFCLAHNYHRKKRGLTSIFSDFKL